MPEVSRRLPPLCCSPRCPAQRVLEGAAPHLCPHLTIMPLPSCAAWPRLTSPHLLCRRSASKRVFLLDHDGTLVAQSSITSKPSQEVLK